MSTVPCRLILASPIDAAKKSLAWVWQKMKGKRVLVVTTALLGEGQPFLDK